MVHLSTQNSIYAMILYSLLTFFVGPLVVRYLKGGECKDPRDCVSGFLLGFTVSIFLWDKYGAMLTKK